MFQMNSSVVFWSVTLAAFGLYIAILVQSKALQDQETKKSVLVIGSAGFFGYHLTSYLADQKKEGRLGEVVAVDSFSEHVYSTSLKYYRAWDLLISKHVDVRHNDVCEFGGENFIELLSGHHFSHVVYLGLEDNIRTSSDLPSTRTARRINDTECFETLLQCLRRFSEERSRPPSLVFLYNREAGDFTSPSSSAPSPLALGSTNEKVKRLCEMFKKLCDKISVVGVRLPRMIYFGSWPRLDLSDVRDVMESLSEDNEGDTLNLRSVQDKKIENMNASSIEEAVTSFADATIFGEVSRVNSEVHVSVKHTQLIKISSADTLKAEPETGDSIEKSFIKTRRWYQAHSGKMAGMPCASECSSNLDCTPSSLDAAAATSRKISEGCVVVYYTVAFHIGQYTLRQVNNSMMGNHCFVAFVKSESPIGRLRESSHNGWQLVKVPDLSANRFGSARRVSRIPKICPTLFFAQTVQYAAYFDTALAPTIIPQEVKEAMSVNGKKVAIGMHFHPQLMTGIDGDVRQKQKYFPPMKEIDAIFAVKNTAATERISQQQKAYQLATELSKGKLVYNVVPTGWMIIHDLNSEYGHRFRCEWFNEYSVWADRDQPPLFYSIAKHAMDDGRVGALDRGDKPSLIPVGGRGNNQEYLRLFDRTPHTRDFLPFFLHGDEEDKGYYTNSTRDGRNIG